MKVAIQTVIYNELDEYLKPWLDYHSPMVDHIFIFEDIGSHSHKHITDKYDNVTLMSVLDIYDKENTILRLTKNKQRGGINQGIYLRDEVLYIQSKNEYDFAFSIDIDEFITLQEPYKQIPDVLSEFQDKDGILIQWMNYGASRRIYKPNYDGRDYREFYTEVGEQTENDKAKLITTKICWNLNKINAWHLCGLHCMAGNWVNTIGNKDRHSIVYDKMYLKHYVTKSFEEYLWKIYIRGMHCGNRHRKIQDFFEINKDMLPMYDECMRFKEEYIK